YTAQFSSFFYLDSLSSHRNGMVLASRITKRERSAAAGVFLVEQQQGRGLSQEHIYIHTNCRVQYDDGTHWHHNASAHFYHNAHHRLHRKEQISFQKAGTSSLHEDQASSHPGQLSRALDALFQSQRAPSNVAYICLLRACTDSKSVVHVKQICAHLFLKNVSLDGLLGDYLVVTLANCGAIDDALDVLYTLKGGTVYSWTAIISAYVKHGCGHGALEMFNRMQEEGVEPNHATFVSLFQASSIILDIEQGKKLHLEACNRGLLCNQLVGNCLINMYIKCGAIKKAEDVFTELPHRDVVSWNTMLSAYADQGQAARVLQLYRQMHEEGEEPDHLTLMSTLQACSILAETQKAYGCVIRTMPFEVGLALHAEAQKRSLTGHEVVGTSLMILYGKCGLVSLAEKVFWASSHRDTVVWNSMLAAYLEQGYGEQALQSYAIMQKECTTLDEVTCMYGLQACGELGSLDICSQIHFAIVFAGCDHVHFIAATLIQAYRSCASMLDAHVFFHALRNPDYVTWTTCIAGHAGDGNFVASLHMFEHLQFSGIEPDEILFTAVLSACNNVGLVIEGLEYFKSLRLYHRKNPHLKHYSIMLELLGRAGNFKEMDIIMKQMPVEADLSIWLSLLGACRTHSHVELARSVFDRVVDLKPDQTLAYILMANIYTNAGLQGCAADVETARHKQGTGVRLIHSVLDDELYTYL
ncbi:hypothetical protein GOP47_0007991, partial [Adiantum capillus-veneris]